MKVVVKDRSFAAAVLRRWIGLASVGGFALVIGIVEHIRGKSLSWAVYTTVVMLGLLRALGHSSRVMAARKLPLQCYTE